MAFGNLWSPDVSQATGLHCVPSRNDGRTSAIIYVEKLQVLITGGTLAINKLGRLERVDLRDAWQTEAGDFTPWLAREENLSLLGETIGIELEHEATEKNVGPFRADILCKDTATGSWVLVENQLESTDHRHLGQLLTYAAGLEVVTIVWVAASFSEEHRAALDWLNQITNERFAFFGLEVELWRIGTSEPAPKFNVISKPNDWSKSVSDSAKAIAETDLSETKRNQQSFWNFLRDYLVNRKSVVKPTRPLPQHWMPFSIGRSWFNLNATLNTQEERCGVELYISHEFAKGFFRLLVQQKAQIEAELGLQLEWQDLSGRKGCRVAFYRPGCSLTDPILVREQMEWFADTLERFQKTFSPRVKELVLEEAKQLSVINLADL